MEYIPSRFPVAGRTILARFLHSILPHSRRGGRCLHQCIELYNTDPEPFPMQFPEGLEVIEITAPIILQWIFSMSSAMTRPVNVPPLRFFRAASVELLCTTRTPEL